MTAHPLRKKDLFFKVCGQIHQAGADCATAYGAKLIGFIFHPASARALTPERAGRICTTGVGRVGVFVNHSAAEICDIMERARLDFAQFHGKQTIADAEIVGADRVIRVLWPETYESLEEIQADIDRWAPHCTLFLLDADRQGGGHGRSINCEHLNKLHFPHPWILAGGLGGKNIRELIARYKPDGIDINSGVEFAPGFKSATEVLAAFTAAE